MGGVGSVGLGGGWDVEGKAWVPAQVQACVVAAAPFPGTGDGTGDVGYGPGLGERFWLQWCAL